MRRHATRARAATQLGFVILALLLSIVTGQLDYMDRDALQLLQGAFDGKTDVVSTQGDAQGTSVSTRIVIDDKVMTWMVNRTQVLVMTITGVQRMDFGAAATHWIRGSRLSSTHQVEDYCFLWQDVGGNLEMQQRHPSSCWWWDGAVTNSTAAATTKRLMEARPQLTTAVWTPPRFHRLDNHTQGSSNTSTSTVSPTPSGATSTTPSPTPISSGNVTANVTETPEPTKTPLPPGPPPPPPATPQTPPLPTTWPTTKPVQWASNTTAIIPTSIAEAYSKFTGSQFGRSSAAALRRLVLPSPQYVGTRNIIGQSTTVDARVDIGDRILILGLGTRVKLYHIEAIVDTGGSSANLILSNYRVLGPTPTRLVERVCMAIRPGCSTCGKLELLTDMTEQCLPQWLPPSVNGTRTVPAGLPLHHFELSGVGRGVDALTPLGKATYVSPDSGNQLPLIVDNSRWLVPDHAKPMSMYYEMFFMHRVPWNTDETIVFLQSGRADRKEMCLLVKKQTPTSDNLVLLSYGFNVPQSIECDFRQYSTEPTVLDPRVFTTREGREWLPFDTREFVGPEWAALTSAAQQPSPTPTPTPSAPTPVASPSANTSSLRTLQTAASDARYLFEYNTMYYRGPADSDKVSDKWFGHPFTAFFTPYSTTDVSRGILAIQSPTVGSYEGYRWSTTSNQLAIHSNTTSAPTLTPVCESRCLDNKSFGMMAGDGMCDAVCNTKLCAFDNFDCNGQNDFVSTCKVIDMERLPKPPPGGKCIVNKHCNGVHCSHIIDETYDVHGVPFQVKLHDIEYGARTCTPGSSVFRLSATIGRRSLSFNRVLDLNTDFLPLPELSETFYPTSLASPHLTNITSTLRWDRLSHDTQNEFVSGILILDVHIVTSGKGDVIPDVNLNVTVFDWFLLSYRKGDQTCRTQPRYKRCPDTCASDSTVRPSVSLPATPAATTPTLQAALIQVVVEGNLAGFSSQTFIETVALYLGIPEPHIRVESEVVEVLYSPSTSDTPQLFSAEWTRVLQPQQTSGGVNAVRFNMTVMYDPESGASDAGLALALSKSKTVTGIVSSTSFAQEAPPAAVSSPAVPVWAWVLIGVGSVGLIGAVIVSVRCIKKKKQQAAAEAQVKAEEKEAREKELLQKLQNDLAEKQKQEEQKKRKAKSRDNGVDLFDVDVDAAVEKIGEEVGNFARRMSIAAHQWAGFEDESKDTQSRQPPPRQLDDVRIAVGDGQTVFTGPDFGAEFGDDDLEYGDPAPLPDWAAGHRTGMPALNADVDVDQNDDLGIMAAVDDASRMQSQDDR